MQAVQIENVRGAPELEHHVVRDVHQRIHRALAAAFKAFDHPGRSLRGGIDVAHHTPGEAATEIGRLDGHRNKGIVRRHHRCDHRSQQGCPREGGHFARNAEDRQRMAQIGRELEREQRVVQVQPLSQVGPHRCVGRQLQQPGAFAGDLQLLGRAQHAVALDPTQLAQFDREGLAVFTRRQQRAHRGQRYLDTHAGIGRAADDLQRAVGAVRTGIDAAHAQAVGVGVRVGGDDLAHHHAAERRGNGVERLDLHAGHRQQVGQRLGIQVGVAEGAQPGFWKLHGDSFVRTVNGTAAGSAGRRRRTGAGR